MPYVRITTNQTPTDPAALIAEASCLIASETGKPEAYVMVILDAQAAISFAASTNPAAFFDVRGIGLSTKTARGLAARLCDLAKTRLGIAQDRVFLNFTDVPADRWGYNGATFG